VVAAPLSGAARNFARLRTALCTFVVMSAAGKRLREQVVETNGESLQDFIGSVTGQKHLCLEEGTMSEWMSRALDRLTCPGLADLR